MSFFRELDIVPAYTKISFYVESTGACSLITSAKEGGYVFSAVCLSVCLSVRRITHKLVNGF